MDVLEPAGGFVEEVLGVAIAEDAAGDADLVPIDAELLLAIGEPVSNAIDCPVRMNGAVAAPTAACALARLVPANTPPAVAKSC